MLPKFVHARIRGRLKHHAWTIAIPCWQSCLFLLLISDLCDSCRIRQPASWFRLRNSTTTLQFSKHFSGASGTLTQIFFFNFILSITTWTLCLAPEKVEKLLATLDPDSATGWDGISSYFQETCSAALAHPVSTLFTIGVLKSAWKSTNITALQKKVQKQISLTTDQLAYFQ